MNLKNKDDTRYIGIKVNMLTVLATNTNKKNYFLCRCECGTEKLIFKSNVIGDKKIKQKSCGCLHNLSGNKNHKFKNLIGEKFNSLLVLSKLEKNKFGHTFWNCLCDCSNFTVTESSKLIGGHTKSCGCRIGFKHPKFLDLTGKIFNNYTVIKRAPTKKRSDWICKCSCGNIQIVNGEKLKNGKLIGCRKCLGKRFSGKNSWAWNHNILDKERKLNKNRSLNPKLKKWRKNIYEKDKFLCQVTKKHGKLNAHHLEGWCSNKKLRYDINNGITLLASVHKLFHHKYGCKNNTKQQFEEFVKNLTQEEINSFT